MSTTDRRGIVLGNATPNYTVNPVMVKPVLAPCRAATTAAITLSGEQTVDGVALVALDRCLVKNQGSGVANGIYIVSTGAWTRPTDCDGAYDVITGTRVFVTNGTVSGGFEYYLSTTGAITIGTTSLTWTLFGQETRILALEAADTALAAQDASTTIDFGAWPGVTYVTKAVTGQTAIAAGSIVQVWVGAVATADHSIDEHVVDPPVVTAGNISAGVGFTIYAANRPMRDSHRHGLWTVNWRWA